MSYREIYEAWKSDPDRFWLKAAEDIDWDRAPRQGWVDQGPAGEWFPDAMGNTCWNAVDRHVEAGRGEQLAIIHDSPVTGSVEKVTYSELRDRVANLAGALQQKGVEKGDRVIIYMPMVPEAIVAMLACARIGAIHSVVFGGFAAKELAVRIDDATPRAVISASCGIEPGRIVSYKPLLDAAIGKATHKPEFTVILQREQETAELIPDRDFEWNSFQQDTRPAHCLSVEGNHPVYILHTSGTTGKPKGVVRHSAGHLVALNWSMKNIYNIETGDVYWAASDVGWVVGHSYICYAPLFAGATTIVFEGKPVGTPDAGTFWRVMSDHKVKSFFTAPTAIRAIKREDPDGKLIGNYDLSALKAVFLAGERADPDTITWLEDRLNLPVLDHWWQTETGWSIAANPFGIEHLPVRKGSPSVAMPGYDVQILDDNGKPVPTGTLGAIAVKLPLPPGSMPTLWNAEARFHASYFERFPGYYETGDAGYIDEDGYLYIMARTDDVINVAGHRLSTGALEEVLASHPAVAEAAVIGASDKLKGEIPLGFLCLKRGIVTPDAQIIQEVVAMVREKIGPVVAFKTACVVERLPKTRSGKILRAVMARVANGENVTPPSTMDDPAILDEIAEALKKSGHL